LPRSSRLNKLQAQPEQIKAMVEETAQSYEHPEEVIRWYYAQPQRLAEVEGVAIEDNVVEWVSARPRLSTKPIAFDELMGQSSNPEQTHESCLQQRS
jgi:trigger factor